MDLCLLHSIMRLYNATRMNEMNESSTVLRVKILVAFIRKILNLFETNKTDFPCLLYEELQCPATGHVHCTVHVHCTLYIQTGLFKDFDPGLITYLTTLF